MNFTILCISAFTLSVGWFIFLCLIFSLECQCKGLPISFHPTIPTMNSKLVLLETLVKVQTQRILHQLLSLYCVLPLVSVCFQFITWGCSTDTPTSCIVRHICYVTKCVWCKNKRNQNKNMIVVIMINALCSASDFDCLLREGSWAKHDCCFYDQGFVFGFWLCDCLCRKGRLWLLVQGRELSKTGLLFLWSMFCILPLTLRLLVQGKELGKT